MIRLKLTTDSLVIEAANRWTGEYEYKTSASRIRPT